MSNLFLTIKNNDKNTITNIKLFEQSYYFIHLEMTCKSRAVLAMKSLDCLFGLKNESSC